MGEGLLGGNSRYLSNTGDGDGRWNVLTVALDPGQRLDGGVVTFRP
ncbi:MAG: hypothetical protein H0W78_11000 [Planctomycetes bacterium]|nr:hypothetical protein [Planctomycetota bacterium]